MVLKASLIWRLLPLAVVAYTMRDGVDSGKELLEKSKAIAYGVQAQMELRGAARHIRVAATTGAQPPSDLAGYMRKNLGRLEGEEDVGRDPWGNEYRLEKRGHRLRLYSCGPDGACGNEDDTVVKVTLPR